MSNDSEITQLLQDKTTIKIIATIDAEGVPHAVASQFLQLGEQGRLVHLELLEKSVTNRNLLRSLWFDRKISVTLTAQDGQSFVIQGRPVKAHISGPVFRHYYEQVRSLIKDADLSTVWLIEPGEVINETYAIRKKEEEELFPFTIHLDRLAVQTG